VITCENVICGWTFHDQSSLTVNHPIPPLPLLFHYEQLHLRTRNVQIITRIELLNLTGARRIHERTNDASRVSAVRQKKVAKRRRTSARCAWKDEDVCAGGCEKVADRGVFVQCKDAKVWGVIPFVWVVALLLDPGALFSLWRTVHPRQTR